MQRKFLIESIIEVNKRQNYLILHFDSKLNGNLDFMNVS